MKEVSEIYFERILSEEKDISDKYHPQQRVTRKTQKRKDIA
jgi:hypothetical protein